MGRLTDAELGVYLTRIGIGEAPAADSVGLRALQLAHRRAIPFENLDVLLGRGVSLDPAAIFTKLVTMPRGGYCFEHNALFLTALRTIGFKARPLLGRVWLGAVDVPPRTHTFSLVHLPDGDWIADAGFGGGDAPPMPLTGNEFVGPDGVTHRLAREAAHGWMLTRNDVPQYSFTEDEVWPGDLAQANHWTATAPASRFIQNLVVSLMTAEGLKSFKRSCLPAIGDPRDAIAAGSLAKLLAADFSIRLSQKDIAALPLIARD